MKEFIKDREIRKISIKTNHITDSDCVNPNNCMIKLAVVETLIDSVPKGRRAHVYARVDATGISITPPGATHRYKAMMPKMAYVRMRQFDELKGQPISERVKAIKPFTITLIFHRGRKVAVRTDARRKQINAARRARKAAGRPDKKYSLKTRLVGVAI